MSLLSDLLSKIKQPETTRDVPPGLKGTVLAGRQRQPGMRRLVILSLFVSLAVGTGFLTVYLVDRFSPIKKDPAQQAPLVARSYAPPATPLLPVRQQEPAEGVPGAPATQGKIPPAQMPLAEQKPGDISRKIEPDTAPAARGNKPEAPLKDGEKPPSAEEKKKPADKVAEAARVRAEIKIPRVQAVPPGPREKTDAPPEATDQGIKELYLYKAEEYEKNKDAPNALAAYKKALGAETNNYRVMNKIASILLQMSMYEEALKYAERSLELRQDYVPALINAAVAYAKTGRSAFAEKNLLKSLSLEETNQTALLNIAVLYEKQGREDMALLYFSKLRALGNPEGARGIERLTNR